MRKTLKIIFCSLVIVTILSANVFASGWAGYTPSFTDEYEIFFTENITSAYSAEVLKNVVDNAYNIGLFGGGVPYAVTCREAEGIENAYSISIYYAAPFIESNQSGISPNKGSVYGSLDTSNGTISCSEGSFKTICILLGNGDICNVLGISTNVVKLDDELLLLIKGEGGEWYYDDNSSFFAQFYNVDATENNALASINEKYLNALEGYTPPSEPSVPSEPPAPPVYVQYMLDIPSIITAIPNGAKQIINNAFGFEIFGINVAGLLSAIIIIAIVAYAVKKMMTR